YSAPRRELIGSPRPPPPHTPKAHAGFGRGIGAMSLVFAAVLTKMVEVRASDVHLTPGFAPAVRVRGRIVPMDDYPPLSPQETREVVYSILKDYHIKNTDYQQLVDFAYAIPSVARFRLNCFFQRGAISAAFRHILTD